MTRKTGPQTALLILLTLCCAAPGAARAACNLSVTENQPVDFGTLQKPSAGSNSIDLALTDTESGSGTLLYGTPVHGEFKIRGTGNCGAGITITLADTGGVTGVSFTGVHLNYNGANITNGQSGLADPGNGKILKASGQVTYTSAVTVGAHSPGFSIRVSSP